MLSIARCALSGVVAKPGIATGSRSDKRAKLAGEKRRNPWVKGSNECGNSHIRTDPFGPTNLTHSDFSLFTVVCISWYNTSYFSEIFVLFF